MYLGRHRYFRGRHLAAPAQCECALPPEAPHDGQLMSDVLSLAGFVSLVWWLLTYRGR